MKIECLLADIAPEPTGLTLSWGQVVAGLGVFLFLSIVVFILVLRANRKT